MTTRTALENLMCHHRIVKAMNGQASEILVTDTLMDRLNDCKAALAAPKQECPNKAQRDALFKALQSLVDAAHWTPTDNWNIGPMDSNKGGKMDMARAALALCEKGGNRES